MKTNSHPQGCRCMMGGRCYGHHGPMHIIIRVVLLIVVFWLGTQFGELHSYRGGMMGGYGGYRGYQMMNDGYYYGGYGPGTATSSAQ